MKKIGKYQIVEILGEGGMGVVYKAFDPLMEREVAIKVLLEKVFDQPELKERFYREARSSGKLSHENITIVHDLGEFEGKPYIVMEYLTGTDLRSIIKEKRDLSFDEKLDYARQICQGLAYSHSKQIIHRDIKPENIRVLDDGKVKIMDFGIAKTVTSTMTMTGTVMGTPHYMSPEQVKGLKVDHRSDIFSFGVLFFELLTYKLPFPGSNPTTVIYKIVNEPPESISEIKIAHISELKNLLLKCLQKDLKKRYQSCDDVIRDLKKIIQIREQQEQKKIQEQKKLFEKCYSESQKYLNKKRFDKAMHAAQEALIIDPDNQDLLKFVEQIQSEEKSEKVKRRVDTALKEARKLLKKQLFDEAVENLDAIEKLQSDNPEIVSLRDVIAKARQQKKQREKIQLLLQNANRFLEADEYESATDAVNQILELEPKHSKAVQLQEKIRKIEAKNIAEKPVDPEDMATIVLPKKDARKKKISDEDRKLPVSPESSGINRYKAIFAAVVFILAGGFIIYKMFFSVTIPYGYVALNIQPWAEVTKIVDATGSPMNASEKAIITPYRLQLPEGAYTLTLKNPAFQDSLVLPVTVRKGEVQKINQKMPEFDYQKIVESLSLSKK